LQVVVGAGDQAPVVDSMAEDDLVPGAAVVGPGDDAAGVSCSHRDSTGHREVDPRMEFPGAVDRVHAPAEVRVQPGIDGIDPAAAGVRRAARGTSPAAAAATAALLLALPLGPLLLLPLLL